MFCTDIERNSSLWWISLHQEVQLLKQNHSTPPPNQLYSLRLLFKCKLIRLNEDEIHIYVLSHWFVFSDAFGLNFMF